MVAYLYWAFENPLDPVSDRWDFPRNPRSMDPLFPERVYEILASQGPDGQGLAFESPFQPYPWSFGGDIVNRAQSDQMRSWFYTRASFRVIDHLGHQIDVRPVSYKPTFASKPRKYWAGTYTCLCTVVRMPTAATVGDVWA